MDADKLKKGNELADKISSLIDDIKLAEIYTEKLKTSPKDRKVSALEIDWRGYSSVKIEKEVAEVAITLIIKKLENQLLQAEKEYSEL